MYNTITIEFLPHNILGKRRAMVSFWKKRGQEKIPKAEYIIMKHDEFELLLSKVRKHDIS